MSTYTQHKGLEKPLSTEKYNVAVANKNSDVIDSELHKLDLKNQSQDELLATKEALNAEISRAAAKENDIVNQLNAEITRATSAEDNISDHLVNEINRATASETGMSNSLSAHISGKTNPHQVTKSQVGLGNVENKSSATIRSEITKSNVTNALGYTPYTPNEVDNKFSALETNIDWKESVETFDDIAKTYPNPQDGWTVNVKDTDYTYRYNGIGWVTISANAIPKATDSVDGLLSKEDHANYDDANRKKHSHSNKSVLDGITSALITAWNNAVEHIADSIKHITSAERTAWNAAKTHADSDHARTDATKVEKSSTNGNVKIDGIETTVYTHPNGTNPHGTTKSDVGLENVPNVSTNDQAPTFTQATSRVNIKSGEKLSIIFGKIMKWFADLKAVAFSGSYNDLSNKPKIPANPEDIYAFPKNGGTIGDPEDISMVVDMNGIQGDGNQVIEGINSISSSIIYYDGEDLDARYIKSADGIANDGGLKNGKIKHLNWEVDMESPNTMEIGYRGTTDKMFPEIEFTTDGHINMFAYRYNMYASKGNVYPVLEFTSDDHLNLYSRDRINITNKSDDITINAQNGELFLHANSTAELNSGNSVVIYGQNKARIKSKEQITLNSNEIRLMPTTNIGDSKPMPDMYVRTGNIKGVDLTDGNKPSISGFGRVGCQLIETNQITSAGGVFYGHYSQLNEKYSHGALQIREADLILNGSTAIEYAPSIGFHWGNVTGGSIIYDASNRFNFLNIVGDPTNIRAFAMVNDKYTYYPYDDGANTYTSSVGYFADRQNWQAVIHLHSDTVIDSEDVYEHNYDNTDYVFKDIGFWVQRANQYGIIYPSLGHSYYRWNNVFAINGTIQTSDRNEKSDIAPLPDKLINAFIMGLKPSSYKMNAGTSGRTHWGLISQDIEDLMETLGMDSTDFAGFIKSPKTIMVEEEEEYEDVDENGETITKTRTAQKEQVVEGEYIYSLRYDEFIAPIIKVVQQQQNEIEDLKDTVQAQQNEMNELKQAIKELKEMIKNGN